MAQSTSTPLVRPIKISVPGIVSRTLPIMLLVAMFGQPNGLFLYLPIYPILALAVLLVFTGALLVSKWQGSAFAWPRTNLNAALALYLILSLFSLSYAPDPALGIRLLGSNLIKIVIFYALIDQCVREDVLRGKRLRSVLKLIMGVSLIFAVQGLSQIVAVAVFHYPPSAVFSSQSELNGASLDFGVISYGIFGLSRQTFAFGDVYIPRCQAIFLEPGFYSNFLELALFASLAYFALYPPVRRWIPSVVLGVQIVALLMTLSPLGIFACGLGTLVYVIFTSRDRARVYLRRCCKLVAVLLVIGTFSQIAFPEITSRLYEVVVVSKFISDEGDITSTEDRTQQFNKGVELFMKRPLLGWGSYQTRVVADNLITNNALVTAATELGVVGLSLYLIMLGCIGMTIVQNFWLSQRLSQHLSQPGCSTQYRGFAGATAASVVAMIFHSLFIEIQWTFYYWIAIALLYISRRALMQYSQKISE